MDPIIVFNGIVIFSIVFSFVVLKIQNSLHKSTWMSNPIKNRQNMPKELWDSRPLDSNSVEYKQSLNELITYNKRMVHRGRIFVCTALSPSILTTILLLSYQLFHGNIAPLRTGVPGVLWNAWVIFIGIYSLVVACIYFQFDFPNPPKHSISWHLDTHNIKVFPDAIRPYLSQGKNAAWYFVRHRNDGARIFIRSLALILIPLTLYFSHDLFADTFRDLSNPPQSVQMQTEYSKLLYSKNYRMYVISCLDTSGNGYDFYLSKREAEEMLEPLLPYFQYEEKTVTSWTEAETVLQDGNYLYLGKNPAKDGVAVFITLYPNTKSLCEFVLGQREPLTSSLS